MAKKSLPELGSPENPSLDFGFAFNDVNFSDRVVRIEILPGSKPDPDDSLEDCARSRKRSRVDSVLTANDQVEVVAVGGEATLKQPSEADTCFLEGHEVAKENESPSSMEYSEVRARTVHVSSPILAAHSPFFCKLFTNGMRESQQRHVTLQIQASEDDAVMDMLSFMYSNKLPRTTPTDLLNVLLVADKFEVVSCMRYCSRLLCSLPMTCESALLYLDRPPTILVPDTVQQLRHAANKFLVNRFKDLTKYEDEILKLPLAGLEVILSSNDLRVSCEDDIYEFVLKWARQHYPKLEERREMLSKHILGFVRFPHMTSRKLRQVLTCGEIEFEVASKLVLDAMLFKAESPHQNLSLVERPYTHRPVKAVELELPSRKCIAFVDFKREECSNLFPSGRFYSQAFHSGEQAFVLSGRCNINHEQPYHCFGLFLSRQGKDTSGLMVHYEIAVGMKHSEDFVSKCNDKDAFIGGQVVGYRDIFTMPWTEFMAEESPYFINGVLHLKVEITIKN